MKYAYETPRAEMLAFDYSNVVAASGHGHGDNGKNGGVTPHGGNDHEGKNKGCYKD